MNCRTLKHTVGSLFSGVGGFEMGFEQTGWTINFQVEIDPHCQKILQKHWPDVPKWSDVSEVNGADLPPVDCIVWGSPCQDLSVAGKRAGLDGERSGLFYQGIRIIKEMRDATRGTFPRWSVWENVAGALSSNGGADFGCILDEMAKIGAVGLEYQLLDAQFFGVPQRRRRVFVVACFDSATFARCPDPLLPVCESLPRDFAARKQKRKDTSAEIAACLRSGGDGGIPSSRGEHLIIGPLTTGTGSPRGTETTDSNHLVLELAESVGALCARDYKGVGSQYVDEGKVIVQAYTKSRRAQTVDDHETWVEGAVNPTLNQFDVGDTRTTTAVVIGPQGNMIGRADHNDPQGKGHTPEGGPMFTLTGTDIHAVVSDMTVRRLTPLECERLMGWPDDHTKWNPDGTIQADSHRYRQCGNGVATVVAKWIAQHLKAVDE